MAWIPAKMADEAGDEGSYFWGTKCRTFDPPASPDDASTHHRPMEKHSYVYILASGRNGTLYIGVTNNLIRRVYEHRNDVVEGFTKQYRVHDLVWYEVHAEVIQAITREKQLKKWNRVWKTQMISKFNPTWRDLYDEIATSY